MVADRRMFTPSGQRALELALVGFDWSGATKKASERRNQGPNPTNLGDGKLHTALSYCDINNLTARTTRLLHYNHSSISQRLKVRSAMVNTTGIT